MVVAVVTAFPKIDAANSQLAFPLIYPLPVAPLSHLAAIGIVGTIDTESWPKEQGELGDGISFWQYNPV